MSTRWTTTYYVNTELTSLLLNFLHLSIPIFFLIYVWGTTVYNDMQQRHSTKATKYYNFMTLVLTLTTGKSKVKTKI